MSWKNKINSLKNYLFKCKDKICSFSQSIISCTFTLYTFTLEDHQEASMQFL